MCWCVFGIVHVRVWYVVHADIAYDKHASANELFRARGDKQPITCTLYVAQSIESGWVSMNVPLGLRFGWRGFCFANCSLHATNVNNETT